MELLTKHAAHRMQQRGVRHANLQSLLEHADVEELVGDNCTLLRVSRDRAMRLNLDDRLHHYGVIWSETYDRVVTVLPVHRAGRGARYRRRR